MLPSTGLFKNILCPFFATDSCFRPFCHFKHAKKDETETKAAPVYTPTVKKDQNGKTPREDKEPHPKKARLEYVPHSVSTKAVTSNLPAPSYIPSVSVLQKSEPDDISLEQIDEELSLISDILQDVESSAEEASVPKYIPSKIVEEKSPAKEKENIEEEKPKKEEKPPDEKKKHKSSRSSDKDRSHSSSSRHHSSKSSHSRSHSSSSSRDRKKSSSSSRHHHSSSSSRKSSKSSSEKSSEKSSTKTSSRSSKSSSSRSKVSPPPPEVDIFALEAESSDEDEIMAQCKMFFDEFTAQEASDADKSKEIPQNTKKAEPEVPDTAEDVTKRKRVAHENAQKRPSLLTAPANRPNHMQNTLQSVYQRQEIVRKQLELAKEQEKPDLQLLRSPPLSPGTLGMPNQRRIAPVSNTIALMNAKKKIEELKNRKTAAQTQAKNSKRMAHANPAIMEQKPAPPVLEASATKISYNLRMQYYNIMVKHCLTIYPGCDDAWQRAQTEELAVFKKCSNPMIYKSSASLTVNKLRKEAIDAGNSQTEKNNVVSHDVILAGKSAHNTSWSINKKTKSDSTSSGKTFDTIASSKAYDLAAECILTDDQLRENGFPRPGGRKGQAKISKTYQKHSLKPTNPDERYCARCSKLFNISSYDYPAVDECNYHPKSTGFRRGFADNQHRCCQQGAGTPGCMYANYHVSDSIDYDNLTGYVTTIERDEGYVCTRSDIFALDCEMCYTTEGLELTRVTVVDIDQTAVYDALVKPDNRIIDYNTTYSGITEAMLSKETRSLHHIQAVLLSMFHSRTILVGHSLESDLKALKMIHNCVVDTSVLYPHKMGPPKKRALKTLCIENLKRIIQENEGGHDSAEDAEVCIALLKHYLKNRIA
ncbi:RNA exonuclease 1 homolog [Sergentomyia squamirostris]